MYFYCDGYGQGWAPCWQCLGKGHLIGSATTTAAECRACLGTGQVRFVAAPKPADNANG